MVRVLYFAWLRERAGRAEEDVALPDGCDTVGALMSYLAVRDTALAEVFSTPGLVRAAVNQDFATFETPISHGDEVAFFPPVTGG